MKWWNHLIAGFGYIAWELWDDIKHVYGHYRNPKYVIADTWLQCCYFFTPVNHLCRWALRHHKDDQVQRIYGETSITNFAKLCSHLELNQQDRFYELGCGRGRLALWLACHTPCQQVVGIDLNPIFIKHANRISRQLRISHLSWLQANILESDLSNATLIYLYGTAFNAQAIDSISTHLSLCSSGTRIVTVSYALEHPAFTIIEQLTLAFVWGNADVFIHQRV